MQLFAYDNRGALVSARHAEKRQNYICLECGSVVRVRRGLYRQSHFYHCTQERRCRLSGKTLPHLHVQNLLQKRLPEGECFLEHPFPAIGRIADVAWLPRSLVFEVQCSSISVEEVEARNRDYRREGFQVVWILHDRRFHRRRESAAERYLRNHPHYYTNMDAEGRGIIYDALRVSSGGLGRYVLGPFPIDVAGPKEHGLSCHRAPLIVRDRAKNWPLCFEGDLLSRVETVDWADIPHEYCEGVAAKQTDWLRCLLTPYRVLFQILLERYAR